MLMAIAALLLPCILLAGLLCAGGALAWSTLNSFPGDGYSVMGTNLPHLVLQPLEGNVQYATDDIVNVHFYQYTPDAIIVSNDSPFKTYQDLVKAAKEAQDKTAFAGSGTNSANHLAHTRLQFVQRERFDQIIVGAAIEGGCN